MDLLFATTPSVPRKRKNEEYTPECNSTDHCNPDKTMSVQYDESPRGSTPDSNNKFGSRDAYIVTSEQLKKLHEMLMISPPILSAIQALRGQDVEQLQGPLSRILEIIPNIFPSGMEDDPKQCLSQNLKTDIDRDEIENRSMQIVKYIRGLRGNNRLDDDWNGLETHFHTIALYVNRPPEDMTPLVVYSDKEQKEHEQKTVELPSFLDPHNNM